MIEFKHNFFEEDEILDEFEDKHIQFCIVDYTIQFYSHIDMIDAYIANRKVEHPFAVIVHSTKY